LRFLVARDPHLLAAVRTVFLRALKSFVGKKARSVYSTKVLLPAGFCVVQRFGSALQLAPHLHAILFDGAYRKDDAGQLHFVAAPAVTPAERLTLVTTIAARIERLLARRGLKKDDQWTEAVTDNDASPMLQLATLAMKLPAAPTGAPRNRADASASAVRGFNLHSETRVSASDDSGRLRLFRYVLRPAIAEERLRFDGAVVTFEMKRTFSDGTRVLTFTPQSFIRRIALLVPAPRQHEITYFGLLAANAKQRADIVRVPTHRRKPRVAGSEPVAAAHHPVSDDSQSPTMHWADLLKRTFAFDVLHCQQCGGRARVVAAITERKVIDQILAHLGAATAAHPARAPPSCSLPRQTLLICSCLAVDGGRRLALVSSVLA